MATQGTSCPPTCEPVHLLVSSKEHHHLHLLKSPAQNTLPVAIMGYKGPPPLGSINYSRLQSFLLGSQALSHRVLVWSCTGPWNYGNTAHNTQPSRQQGRSRRSSLPSHTCHVSHTTSPPPQSSASFQPL